MAGSYGGPISLDLPYSRLVIARSSFQHPKSDHKAVIGRHHFNYAVEITVPGAAELPAKLHAHSQAQHCYHVAKMPLSGLLEPTLLAAIQSADVRAMSRGPKIDGENVAVLLPTGELLLSLDKSTYEQLGLQGKPAMFNSKGRFHVRVDLRDENFSPGKKVYDRVKWCLTDRLPLVFDFAFVWRTDDAAITAELDKAMGIAGGTETRPEALLKLYKNVEVPTVSEVDLDDDTEALDLYEWLGAISCHLTVDGSLDSYHNSLLCPSPNDMVGVMRTERWTGIFHPVRILGLIEAASAAVDAHSLCWIAVTVWGFQDSPVSWSNQEHGFGIDGANHYTFVCLPSGRYIRMMALDPHDQAS